MRIGVSAEVFFFPCFLYPMVDLKSISNVLGLIPYVNMIKIILELDLILKFIFGGSEGKHHTPLNTSSKLNMKVITCYG